MAFNNPASDILWKFLGFLDRIYGMYIDACIGVEMYAAKIEQSAASLGSERDKTLFIGNGDPNRDGAEYKHAASIGTVIDRNIRDGENQFLISQSCIIFVYTVWDTSVRSKYANALGLEQKEIQSSVFGDLRHYRSSIIHNNAILDKETEILDFLRVGDHVVLNRTQMDTLFSLIFDEISSLNERLTNEAFDLQFLRRLNTPDKSPDDDRH